jgi:LmbE family N-acetylglucosaminyl deacetylase
MHSLRFDDRSLRTVLCFGAHCDDVEIGCGGTLLELCARHPGLQVHWIILTTEHTREAETQAAARRLCAQARCTVEVLKFRGSYLPHEGAAVKDAFENVKSRIQPDLIFTHWLEDRHQDHRVVSELTWNTFRNHLILEYEIPKYEGDLGHPGLYVPLTAEQVTTKVEVLMECFPSQRARAWFTPDLFRALMRLRGMECNAPSGFAEAFHARKVVV